MKRLTVLKHEFVRTVPRELEDGTIYVSVDFATAVHRCCCGCGQEVVTPLSPTDWKLIYDGVSVSLYPSVGNWSFKCQSHYWVRQGKVVWAPRMSKRMIAEGRARDRELKDDYFGILIEPPVAQKYDKKGKGKKAWLAKWFGG